MSRKLPDLHVVLLAGDLSMSLRLFLPDLIQRFQDHLNFMWRLLLQVFEGYSFEGVGDFREVFGGLVPLRLVVFDVVEGVFWGFELS